MTRLLQTGSYRPTEVSAPGETLAEMLEERGLSQAELALRCGVSAKHINGVLKGVDGISPQFALSLEKVLGLPASFWNSRESRYQEYLARSEDQRLLAMQLEWLSMFPRREMQRRGYISRADRSVATLEELLRFLGVASPAQWNSWWAERQLAFRFSGAATRDLASLAVWLRAGELSAMQIECRPYDEEGFEAALLSTIRPLSRLKPGEFIPILTVECARHGVRFALIDALPRTGVSGAARWLNPGSPLIQLSLRYRTDDMFWFAFFHEACHILRHRKKLTYLQDGRFEADDTAEEQANRFAAELLLPAKSLKDFCAGELSAARVTAFAAQQGISAGIVVGRLQHEALLAFNKLNQLKQKLEP